MEIIRVVVVMKALIMELSGFGKKKKCMREEIILLNSNTYFRPSLDSCRLWEGTGIRETLLGSEFPT